MIDGSDPSTSGSTALTSDVVIEADFWSEPVQVLATRLLGMRHIVEAVGVRRFCPRSSAYPTWRSFDVCGMLSSKRSRSDIETFRACVVGNDGPASSSWCRSMSNASSFWPAGETPSLGGDAAIRDNLDADRSTDPWSRPGGCSRARRLESGARSGERGHRHASCARVRAARAGHRMMFPLSSSAMISARRHRMGLSATSKSRRGPALDQSP